MPLADMMNTEPQPNMDVYDSPVVALVFNHVRWVPSRSGSAAFTSQDLLVM